jgi:acetoin utilization deacetylase AcuC-like enzyme
LLGGGDLAECALIYDEVFLKHETGAHPENKERVRYAYEALVEAPVFNKTAGLRPLAAPVEDLMLVHDRAYVESLSNLPEGEYAALDPDTLLGPGSLEAAYTAAGAVTTAVKAVTEDRFRSAFCMIRPPGHHARPGGAMGFCIFNNIAVGAAYALEHCDHQRIAIIDFDVHHGNGTQEMFYEDERVLYASIHQYPFYPGSGAAAERGSGKGTGKTLNIPLPGGSGEEVYLEVFSHLIVPAVIEHAPSLIMISAGFDAHRDDPIGGMRLESESYRKITALIAGLADRCCSGKVVSVLEGGYNLDALARSICAHVDALSG